jgi:hypothetical protein
MPQGAPSKAHSGAPSKAPPQALNALFKSSANPYTSGGMFSSAPMAGAPIQNVTQPTSAPQPELTLQQKIAQFQQKGGK